MSIITGLLYKTESFPTKSDNANWAGAVVILRVVELGNG